MSLNDSPTIISIPENLQELLSRLHREPSSVIFAGGTWLAFDQYEKNLNLGKNVLSLQQIDELKKVDRTERYIEFGSCTTLARIANMKAKIIPPILKDAISQIIPPQIRNVATIGGNLAVRDYRMSLYPALMVLDAKIELRSHGKKNRWVEIRRFITEEKIPDIRIGEIITRIRIPIENWDFQRYKAIGKRTKLDQEYSILTIVAKTNRRTILDTRILIIDGKRLQIRPIQTEGNLISKNIPLAEKDKKDFIEIFSKEIANHPDKLSKEEENRLTRLFQRALTELSELYTLYD